MPEPTLPATAAALAVPIVAVPVVSVFGVSLGLRPDMLMAGFAGGLAAIAFLNSVPSTGDTWRELLRTSWRRLGVMLGSALVAGYIAPLLSLINGVPEGLVLSVAFVAGAGAPQMLPWLIERFGKGQGTKPPPGPPAGTSGGNP